MNQADHPPSCISCSGQLHKAHLQLRSWEPKPCFGDGERQNFLKVGLCIEEIKLEEDLGGQKLV